MKCMGRTKTNKKREKWKKKKKKKEKTADPVHSGDRIFCALVGFKVNVSKPFLLLGVVVPRALCAFDIPPFTKNFLQMVFINSTC